MVVKSSKTSSKKASNIVWSQYSLNIFDAVENGEDHLQIEGVAGSGKTRTIIGIVERLKCSRQPTLILAFNRHIVDEITERIKDSRPNGKLPSGLLVTTVHAYGLSVLRRYFGGKPLEINERKTHVLVTDAIRKVIGQKAQQQFEWQQKKEQNIPIDYTKERKLPFIQEKRDETEAIAFLKNIIRLMQLTLTPEDADSIYKMIDHFGIEAPEIVNLLEWAVEIMPEMLRRCEKEAADNLNINHEDCLWLPNRWDLRIPSKSWLLVDEVQDANAAMIGIYKRIIGDTGRLIAFGDEKQAIMGFTGSDAYSWQQIKEAFNTQSLPLSVCYRCPTSHIELAARFVPQIEPRPDAIAGEIQVLEQKYVVSHARPGDLILCRFTAPLVEQCLEFIKQRINATVRGKDIGVMIVNLIKKIVSPEEYPSQFKDVLDEYCQSKIAQFVKDGEDAKAESLEDRYECIKVCFDFFSQSKLPTLDDFCEAVGNLFSDTDSPIILSSIHRAKGDEADNVFILASNYLPFYHPKIKHKWQIQQEKNLAYVALTRGKVKLYFVPLARNEGDKAHMKMYLEHPYGGMSLPKPTEPTSESAEPEPQPEPEAESESEVAIAQPPEPQPEAPALVGQRYALTWMGGLLEVDCILVERPNPPRTNFWKFQLPSGRFKQVGEGEFIRSDLANIPKLLATRLQHMIIWQEKSAVDELLTKFAAYKNDAWTYLAPEEQAYLLDHCKVELPEMEF